MGCRRYPVGRIPVRTAEEAALVVSKIIAYENAEAGTMGSTGARCCRQDGREDISTSREPAQRWKPCCRRLSLPSKFFRSQGDDETTRTRIIDSINEGKLLVNYIGHGSVEIWRGGVFTSDDVATLPTEHACPSLWP